MTEKRSIRGIIRNYLNGIIAAEISAIARYFSQIVQVSPLGNDDGTLLRLIKCSKKIQVRASQDLAPLINHDPYTCLLLNGNLNHTLDIHSLFRDLAGCSSRSTRVICVCYNPYIRWIYLLASRLGLRDGAAPKNFVTRVHLDQLAKLASLEIVRIRQAVFFPFEFFGIGTLLNKLLACVWLLRWFGLVSIVVLRPVMPLTAPPSLSILIPARNEKGTVEAAIRRFPKMTGIESEIIFVEGHSTDGTWEEIERVMASSRNSFSIHAFKQTGSGKCNAVREGLQHATKELVCILDADLSTAPELIPQFVDAYVCGHGDFVNGNRLVYPAECDAMRALNRLGNLFFAKVLRHVLDIPIGDALCGTKLFSKKDAMRFEQWRNDFGDLDPFGDFELLFPAAQLGLGVVEVPIHYRARTYGSTNIARFRDGLRLLRMTLLGFLRVNLGKTC